MELENVLLEKEGNIGILSVNRPKALNALNEATLLDIDKAIDAVAVDDEIDVLIVTELVQHCGRG